MKTSQMAIVIVNYNGIRYSVECIKSIYESCDKNVSIIFIDNGSINNEADIIKSYYCNVVVIKSDYNGGFSYGNNLGIKYALDNNFEYIMLLNNDTVVDKNMIKNLRRYCDDTTVTVPQIRYFDCANNIWYGGGVINKVTGNSKHININDISKKQIKCSFATGCCILLKSSVIKRIGLLNEEYFMYCEDTDYSIRLNINGVNIKYVPEAILYHKVGVSTGGEKSPFSVYYNTRNRILYIKKYHNFFYCTAYMFTIITRIIRLIQNLNKEEVVKSFFGGICDGIRGINGRYRY